MDCKICGKYVRMDAWKVPVAPEGFAHETCWRHHHGGKMVAIRRTGAVWQRKTEETFYATQKEDREETEQALIHANGGKDAQEERAPNADARRDPTLGDA